MITSNLELLARITKLKLPELLRRIVKAHLDKGSVNLKEKHGTT